MIPDSKDVLDPDGQHLSNMVQRLRKLLCKRQRTSRFEVALWCWLLLDVGAQLRGDKPLPSAFKHWRKVETRTNLAALVRYVDEHILRTLEAGAAERTAPGAGDPRRRGATLREVIGVRDFAESARVALRWLCVGKRFAAEDLPGWASLSRQVERLDERIAACAQADPPKPSELWLVDLDDAANWLARLGVRPRLEARRRAPSKPSHPRRNIWPWPGEGTPDWLTVHGYLVDGEHERLVLRHAEADPEFARTLELIIRFWGRRASRHAASFAARRSISCAETTRRQSRPEVRLLAATPRPASALAPSRVTVLFAGEVDDPLSASCFCASCAACHVGTSAGEILRFGGGASGVWEPEARARTASRVAALCHLHLPALRAGRAEGAELLLLAGTDEGMLCGFREAHGQLEPSFAVNIAGFWASAPPHDGGTRRLRFGDTWLVDALAGGGAGITAIAALPHRGDTRVHARGALVATSDGALHVIRLHRSSLTLRRLEVSLRGAVHTIAPVADGVMCLSTAGELVNLHGDALRGAGEPEVLGRFEAAAMRMAPLDDGFAPVLLLSGSQGVWIYDVARDRRVALKTPADAVSRMTRVELADGPHIVLGTVGGEIEVWSVESLLSWVRRPTPQGFRPRVPLLLRSPRHAAGEMVLLDAVSGALPGKGARSLDRGWRLLHSMGRSGLRLVEISDRREHVAQADPVGAPSSEKGPVSGTRSLPGEAATSLPDEKERPRRDLA